MSDETHPVERSASFWRHAVLPALGACLAWAYWPTLGDMADRWWHDAHYTHGFLVPLFALALPWLGPTRTPAAAVRPTRGEGPPRPPGAPADSVTTRASWAGVLLIGVGALVQVVGTYYFVGWLVAASMLPMLAGICTLVGGWSLLRRAWPSVAFLVFMIPLPYRVELALGGPLQRLATLASTFVLQTLGFAAVADANIVRINDHEYSVVEACNGLGMLVTFVTIAVALVLVIDRRRGDKALIILSAVPIALLANIARITITGVLTELVGNRWGDAFFHDFAGWLMMPLALGLLGVELWLLSRLLIEPPREIPLAIGLLETGAARRVPARRLAPSEARRATPRDR